MLHFPQQDEGKDFPFRHSNRIEKLAEIRVGKKAKSVAVFLLLFFLEALLLAARALLCGRRTARIKMSIHLEK